MKILLREYHDQQYVWVTAKYNENGFIVDTDRIDEFQVVSIINDNRKNYVKCSSCGKIISKNKKKFEAHKRNAVSYKTCFTCPYMRVRNDSARQIKYTLNKNGEFARNVESSCRLTCMRSFYETEYDINSYEAIQRCKARKCENAFGMEVSDIFTQMPGVFDDIITIDKLVDKGYERLAWRDTYYSEYVLDGMFNLRALVNNMNIVDRFTIDYDGWCYSMWYSKKYDEIFASDSNGKYILWEPPYDRDDYEAIKAQIRNYYN